MVAGRMRGIIPLFLGSAASALLVGCGGAPSSGELARQSQTTLDSIPWDGLPTWVSERATAASRPDETSGAYVYQARVLSREITNSRQAEISLEATEVQDNVRNEESGRREDDVAVIKTVRTDLAWIEAGCDEMAAKTQLDKLLPDGQPVLVIEPEREAAFLHLIPELGQLPSAPPPESSVNEQLVATGTWFPTSPTSSVGLDTPYWFNPLTESRTEVRDTWAINRGQDALEPVEVQYVSRLLTAINVAWRGTPGGQACAGILDDAAARARLEAEAEAERRRTALPPPPVSPSTSGGFDYGDGTPCGPNDRDGDGDGICNER